MNILKNYKNFINENINNFEQINNINELPKEVLETSKKIVMDIFDKVKKPNFYLNEDGDVILKFTITENDFSYIDKDEVLTLDLNLGAKKKRNYDVSLTYFDQISETYEVEYKVNFDLKLTKDNDSMLKAYDDDDDDFNDVTDDYDKIDLDDDFEDDDNIELNILKEKLPDSSYSFDPDDIDINIDEDDDDF